MSRPIAHLLIGLGMAALAAGCVSGPTPIPTVTPLPSASPTVAAEATPTVRPTSSASAALPPRPAPPKEGAFDPASVAALNLADYPVLPTISAGMIAIYRDGLARGNNPHVFSKLGDCMTENPYFLGPFSEKKYDLGAYSTLQTTIEQFAGVPARQGEWAKDSFATPGLASARGFNVAGPLDPTWANPNWCQNGESPAACEYRVAKPSLAIIMFGTNDASYTEAATYDYYLRSLVELTLDHGILPLLNTFPYRPENPDKTVLLNKIVVKIALDYGVPLINLNRALEPLPNHGVDPKDAIHLSVPPDQRVDVFSEANLQYGFAVRNLVTLQALQAVLAAANP